MLRSKVVNENNTIRNYRRRHKQGVKLEEFGTATHIRTILLQEQEHRSVPK